MHLSKEELANVITHGFGLLIFLIAAPWMLYWFDLETGSPKWMGLFIYGLSLIGVYASSTIYHALREYAFAKILLKIDHICIFFLIAGTHTPLLLFGMENKWSWVYLTILWTMVGLGIVYKILWIGKWPWLSLSIYLAMGWMGAVTLPLMWENLPFSALTWLIVGGISYSLGVIFYVWRKVPYHHAIWHLFVLLGSGAHFISILELAAS